MTGQIWSADGLIRHHANCTNPDDVRIGVGRYGDKLVRCRSCSAFGVITPAADRQAKMAAVIVQVEQIAAAPKTARKRAPAKPVGVWRCGAHPDQPVTVRGRGCPDCAQALAEAREARAARRRRKTDGD